MLNHNYPPRLRYVFLIVGVLFCSSFHVRAETLSDENRIEIAEEAFAAGKYQEVIEGLSSISQSSAQSLKAIFLSAYAHYKMGQKQEAKILLDESLAVSSSTEAAFLRGMIAMEEKDWSASIRWLGVAAQATESPYSKTASRFLQRVHEIWRIETEAAKEKDFFRHFDSGKVAYTKKDYFQAKKYFSEAEKLKPNYLLLRYYQGLIAFNEKKFRPAKAYFQMGLQIEPQDGWSRYMLALTYLQLQEETKGIALLKDLAEHAPEIRIKQAAQKIIKDTSQAVTPTLKAPSRRINSDLEIDTGFDSNPDILSQQPSSDEEYGGFVDIAARVSYRRLWGSHFKWALGLKGLERNYFNGQNEFASTELGVWTEARLILHPFEVGLGYTYLFSLLGHSPYASLHTFPLETIFRITPWLHISLSGDINIRQIHQETYRYFQGTEIGGASFIQFLRRAFMIEVGYQARRNFGQATPTSFIIKGHRTQSSTYFIGGSDGGSSDFKGAGGSPLVGGSGSSTTAYSFILDDSYYAHGPAVHLAFRLPWKLSLMAGLSWNRRSYLSEEKYLLTDGKTLATYPPRHDDLIIGQVEFLRPIYKNLSFGIHYEFLLNISSITLQSDTGLDHNYSRHLAAGFFRWSLF